jgi:hypothetical protein
VRPDHGGRLELKLSVASAHSARYRLTIFTSGSELTTHVDVDAESGTLEMGEWLAGAPPTWLVTVARALVRGVWRSKTSAGDWPRRVTRWRAPPKD